MGFYVKDLYVHRVPKFRWHDKLTNPPTVPETSPIIEIAALSPQIAVLRGGGGGGRPARRRLHVYPIPSWLSPIVHAGPTPRRRPTCSIVRESLAATLKAVEQQIDGLQGTAEDIAYAASVLKG